MEHGRARGESLGTGVGVEELNVLFGEADADLHTSILPPVVLQAEHPRGGAILPAIWGTPDSGALRLSTVRISDLLTQPGTIVPEGSVWTTCPSCGQTQHMDEAPVKETSEQVIYECAGGCGPILTMTFAAMDPAPAIHMRDWAVENPSALFCRPITGDQESIRFPPSV